ncbi:hypothetical protein BJ973_009258 [Actinoplanes tereljensis]|uniref:O-methyltransferase n=1 Tax=Paractinoplanes tereljensis TaxID=571912 RepID=A0A919NGY4_9ACTN|nr:methyltransferase [Actinoplanes tereljensis]GIF17777.1 O-methyltransferase [Actinoplanes tereljensis]
MAATPLRIGPEPLPVGSGQSPFEAAGTVRRFVQMMWSSGLVQAATDLRIADRIDEPVALDELARRTGTDPAALLRLMRALAAHGFFAAGDDGTFRHTEFSRALREDAPGSVRNLTLLANSEWNWRLWGNVADAVRTGEAVFPSAYGKDLYSYFRDDNPEAATVFNRAMSESGKWTTGPIVEALDLDGVRTVADVGGGQGGLLAGVLAKNQELLGTLLDSPEVLRQAGESLRTGGELADRVTLIPADIRESVPVTADLYVMRQVMHIWDDETCLKILRNCAASAKANARIVLVEHVVTEGAEPNPTFTVLLDLLMMLIGPGRERTERDFGKLLDAAGFDLVGVTRIHAPLALVTGELRS